MRAEEGRNGKLRAGSVSGRRCRTLEAWFDLQEIGRSLRRVAQIQGCVDRDLPYKPAAFFAGPDWTGGRLCFVVLASGGTL
jgi:hypothetical protein